MNLTKNGYLDRVIHMKMVWLYVMVGSMGVFIGALVQSISRLDSRGIDWLVILLWCVTVISISTAILGFYKAAKLGREEDDIKRRGPTHL